MLPCDGVELLNPLPITTARFPASAQAGVPPHYDLSQEHQQIMVPFVYGVMHCTLYTLGILPLTMCRRLIRLLSPYPLLVNLFRLEHVNYWHRTLGYAIAWGILVGAAIWCVPPSRTGE